LALDREDTLKKAEKLLRQGRLDGAIAEYVRVVEDQPRDWNTANALGDLYARGNQPEKAVAQYARIADHFLQDGFYPKASALYKKILKLVPDQEQAQLHLAEISVKQGLLKDAKTHYAAIEARRRARGDTQGADEIVVRLGTVDPADLDARAAAARALAASGDEVGAAVRFRELYSDLLEKGRQSDALKALGEAVRLNPGDRAGRALLASAAVAAGDMESARGYLDRETAGEDPALLMLLVSMELRSDDLTAAREILPPLLALKQELRGDLIELAWTLCETNAEAAFLCVDVVVDLALAASEFDDAASLLQEFVARVPMHVPALLKLVEICVDGGLETSMYDAQAQLTDAYLAASQASEARVIAEDLVAREPWEAAHIDRFRRALVMLRVPEPDSVIAERLSGQTPFIATDHFADPVAPEPPTKEAAPQEAPIVPAAHPETAVESSAPVAPAAPVPKVPRTAGVEIDLTSVLGDLQSHPAAPQAPPPREHLDDVFGDVRSAASRKGAPDQSAQHMKLAQTYLEMGMLDEATAALKTASRSPRYRFEAGAMLARLYKEQGDTAHAIEWFERAAEAPAASAEEGVALLYDLAFTLEETGETARALAVFLEIQADAADYRDVAERVDRLSRVQAGG
jgi:tetratricopeptide (TPR) repeat protein